MANDRTDYWGRIVADNDKSFEKVQDELYYQHHYHPTNIPHYNTSASEDARQAELDAQTAQLAKQGKGEHWINGLPGSVSSEPLTGGGGGQARSGGCVGFFVGVAVLTMLIMILFAVMANTGGL